MAAASGFSLVDGGPLCALLRRLGWTTHDGRIGYLHTCLVLVAVAWGPLFLASVAARLMTGHAITIDVGVLVRLLPATPLLRADAALHARTRAVVARFEADRWAPGQSEQLDAIVARTLKLRDAVYPEVALL